MLEVIVRHFESISRDIWEIKHTLRSLERKIDMAATKQDLDNALTAVEGVVAKLGTDLQAAIADLLAKITAGGTPSDFQPEVDRINAIATSLQGFDASATSADPGPSTPTP